MAQAPCVRLFCVSETRSFITACSAAVRADSRFDFVGSCAFSQAAGQVPASQPEVIIFETGSYPASAFSLLKKADFSAPVIAVVPSLSHRSAALAAGAQDVVVFPEGNTQQELFFVSLLTKARVSASLGRGKRLSQTVAAVGAPIGTPVLSDAQKQEPTIIAIGASTGGTEAILDVLKNLPANMPGIVIVQHMPPVFTNMYAQRLNNLCKMEVKEAQNMDRVYTGRVLVAAGGLHMRLCKDASGYYVKCAPGEKVSGHCPSVNVLFESVAKTAGSDALGVLLTGMGADGAQNLLTMKNAGAYTIGQDQESCVVYGMPMEAYKIGGVSLQLPLNQIAGELIRQVQLRRK